MWSPGAQADVGGEYQDSTELPEISLNWMLSPLDKHYTVKNGVPLQNAENAKGLAHWSIGDFPANLFSDCEDRVMSPEVIRHPSYEGSARTSSVPILIDDKKIERKYPSELSCSEE